MRRRKEALLAAKRLASPSSTLDTEHTHGEPPSVRGVGVCRQRGTARPVQQAAQASIVREMPATWVQVVWRPDTLADAPTDGSAPVIDGPAADWLVAPRVEVRYQLRWLGSAKPTEAITSNRTEIQRRHEDIRTPFPHTTPGSAVAVFERGELGFLLPLQARL